jgi:hypothetical protein
VSQSQQWPQCDLIMHAIFWVLPLSNLILCHIALAAPSIAPRVMLPLCVLTLPSCRPSQSGAVPGLSHSPLAALFSTACSTHGRQTRARSRRHRSWRWRWQRCVRLLLLLCVTHRTAPPWNGVYICPGLHGAALENRVMMAVPLLDFQRVLCCALLKSLYACHPALLHAPPMVTIAPAITQTLALMGGYC